MAAVLVDVKGSGTIQSHERRTDQNMYRTLSEMVNDAVHGLVNSVNRPHAAGGQGNDPGTLFVNKNLETKHIEKKE